MKKMLPEAVDMTPSGRNSDELSPEEFARMEEQFFTDVMEIGKADISGTEGYGEFTEEKSMLIIL